MFLTVTVLSGLVLISNYYSDFWLFRLSGYQWWVLSDNEYIAFIKFFYFFMAGASIYLFKDKIIFSYRFILLSIILLIFASQLFYLKYAEMLLLPYIVIALGIGFRVNNFNKYADFSYGLYIYAFPIQQLITFYFGKHLNIATYFFFSLVATMVFSFFSWHLVEKPVMGMKSKFESFLVRKNETQIASNEQS